MKHQTLIRIFTAIAVMLTVTFTAEAQLGGILKKAKEAVKKEVEKVVEEKTAPAQQQPTGTLSDNVKGVVSPGKSAGTAVAGIPKGTKNIYVSAAGSNRNTGGKEDPYKDIQKAVDEAPEGAVIHITEGFYLGKLNAGYIEVKKYISLIAGYSSDFSERDPSKYRTIIQPPANAGGTNANKGLLDIYVTGNRNGLILVDGFTLDKGMQNKYVSLEATNPKFKAPQGCETGILNPPNADKSAFYAGSYHCQHSAYSRRCRRTCSDTQLCFSQRQSLCYTNGKFWRTLRNLQQYFSCQPHGSL